MKRLVFIAIAAVIFSVSASAQLFQYGIKGGINFSTLKMEDITGISDGTDVYNLVTGESVRGYQIGAMARVKVAMVYVQPELYFAVTGGSVEQVMENGATELLDVQFNRIDIPLLVGVKFGPARINVGPVGSAVVGSKNELQDLFSDLETVSSGLTWGFQAGVGIDVMKKLTLDVRYEGSLSQYGDSFTVGGMEHTLDARPTQWIVALGWMF